VYRTQRKFYICISRAIFQEVVFHTRKEERVCLAIDFILLLLQTSTVSSMQRAMNTCKKESRNAKKKQIYY
jgi:hypothetical protein